MAIKWRIASGRGDFLPLWIGFVMVVVSVPAFFLLLFFPDRNPGPMGIPLLTMLGVGMVIGIGFVILGVQQCAMPGSRLYRLAHGRLFWY